MKIKKDIGKKRNYWNEKMLPLFTISYAVTSLDKQNRSLPIKILVKHNYVLDFAFYKLFSFLQISVVKTVVKI